MRNTEFSKLHLKLFKPLLWNLYSEKEARWLGMAAIDHAVDQNNMEAVKILLEHGAAVTSKTLELAEELPDNSIMDLLRSKS